MNTLEIQNKITEIREMLTKTDTEERKEIKKNNAAITQYIKEIEEIKNNLSEEIKSKYSNLINGINHNYEDNTDKINELKNLIKIKGDYSYLYKLDFDKNLYEIKYSNNIDLINENIDTIINQFSKTGIILSKEHFNYSLSVYKYMECFFEYRNKDNSKIKETFDDLYWNCPNLINHIFLSFLTIIQKYQNQFNDYLKSIESDKNIEILFNEYHSLIEKKNTIFSTDEGILYDNFINQKLRIEDYSETNYREILSKYIELDKFDALTEIEVENFYERLKEIYDNLCENIMIEKYKTLIDKVKTIYSSKDTYKNNYNEFKNKIKTLEKKKDKLNKNLFIINNRILNGKKFGTSKYSNLFNSVNSIIDEIIANYDNYDETLFINDLLTKINDDSTYYEGLCLYLDNYSYFRKLMEEDLFNEYQLFLMEPTTIIKSIPLIRDINISDKLVEKCLLYGINIKDVDQSKLVNDLKYLCHFNSVDKDIIDKIKLLIDVSKVIPE